MGHRPSFGGMLGTVSIGPAQRPRARPITGRPRPFYLERMVTVAIRTVEGVVHVSVSKVETWERVGPAYSSKKMASRVSKGVELEASVS